MKIKTILHPTDFSAASQRAFEFASSLARDYGARLIALHVIDVPVAYPELVVGLDVEALRREAQGLLEALEPPADEIPIERVVVEGEPGYQILRIANERDADLIVLGTHGRTGIRRVIMGSIAEHVVRHAACPVIAVKVPGLASEAAEEPAAGGHSANSATS
jgi:nucleotide-binding universal stress UspA family protein